MTDAPSEPPPAPPRRIAWGLIALHAGICVYLIGVVAVAVILRFREMVP